MNKKKKVVFFSGGRGLKNILPVFINKDFQITVIVNSFDDGLSTGKIRNTFNMPGPSDLRKVQSLFISDENLKYIFNFRIVNTKREEVFNNFLNFIFKKNRSIFGINFEKKYLRDFFRKYLKFFFYEVYGSTHWKNVDLYDYSLINCLYAGINNKTKNFPKTVKLINNVFKIPHNIIPSCTGNFFLSALRENNQILYSESDIVEQRSNCRIKKIFVTRKSISKYKDFNKLKLSNKIDFLENKQIIPSLNKDAIKFIRNADIIVYSPGTQYSSLYPTYIHKNLNMNIINNRKAIKIFITNIGADYETPNFSASEYILNAYNYLNKKSNYRFEDFFNYNFINLSNVNKKNYVKIDYKELKKLRIKNIIKNFEDTNKQGYHSGKKILNNIIKIYE